MTKFCTMTVRVPIDDALPVTQVHEFTRQLLEERGMDRLVLSTRVNGDAHLEVPQADLPDTPAPVGRIHWAAVEVMQAREPPPPPPPAKTRRAASPAT